MLIQCNKWNTISCVNPLKVISLLSFIASNLYVAMNDNEIVQCEDVLFPLLPGNQAKDRQFHPILNLSVKRLPPCEKVIMETLIFTDLRPARRDFDDFSQSEDAYLHVPIRLSHRRVLRFMLREQKGVYQWGVVPFGLAIAAQLYKVSGHVVAHLRFTDILQKEYGYLPCPWLADSILKYQKYKHLTSSSAGFCDKPSNVFPCSLADNNTPRYAHIHVDTLTGIDRPISDKIQITYIGQHVLDVGYTAVQHLQRVVGSMAACPCAMSWSPCVCFGTDWFLLTSQGISRHRLTVLPSGCPWMFQRWMKVLGSDQTSLEWSRELL